MKAFNHKYTTVLFIIFILFTTSCDFLELESANDIDADTYFTKAAHAEDALIGLYSAMQTPSYYGGNYLLVGEPLSGNSVTGGFDNINIDEFGFRAVTPSNIIVEEMWYGIYNVIANANRLIEGIEKIDDPAFDPDRKDEIEGQARAIRAMAHFDLLRFFGEHWDSGSVYGIPVINKVQEIGDVEPRATVAESYTFIIDELVAAMDLVNQNDRNPAFVNKATVHALLARVYLYNKSYSDAITHANAVIGDAAFGLLNDAEYASVFTSRQTTESIFELAFDSQNRSRYNGLTYSRQEAFSTEVNFLADSLLNNFFLGRAGDVRETLVDFDPDNNPNVGLKLGRTQKYRGEVSEDNPAYIIRLAEMYLIYAEANALKGTPDWNEALIGLNAVREKRGLTALTLVDIPNVDAFKRFLLDEIRAEFNFEGHYYFDLARVEEIKPGGLLDLDAFRAILPIPLRELIATQGEVVQNPGYE